MRRAHGDGADARSGDPGPAQAPTAGAEAPSQSDDDDNNEDDNSAVAAGEAEPPRAPEPVPSRGPLGMPAHGSKQIKVGLVVPDDFALPEGYVRHYQATDKGQMLPAILMFHPDFTPVGADGRELPMPADRVVPPELAPPGLQHTWLDVPKDAYSKPDDQEPPTAAEEAAAEAAGEEEEGSPDP